MTQFIQKFIEKNIELIEDNEWDKVFLEWYVDAEDIWPDNIEFEDFINTLESADIKPDMFSRYEVLFDEIVWILQNAMKDVALSYSKSESDYHIKRSTIINNLNSKLGYTTEEVHTIMDEAAKSLNMSYIDYSGGEYTWQ